MERQEGAQRERVSWVESVTLNWHAAGFQGSWQLIRKYAFPYQSLLASGNRSLRCSSAVAVVYCCSSTKMFETCQEDGRKYFRRPMSVTCLSLPVARGTRPNGSSMSRILGSRMKTCASPCSQSSCLRLSNPRMIEPISVLLAVGRAPRPVRRQSGHGGIVEQQAMTGQWNRFQHRAGIA
jgi:hypothetical protein